MRAKLPTATISLIDDLAFKVRLKDGSELTVAADNLHRAVEAEPERRAELIDRFARTVADSHLGPSPPGLGDIVSVVRTRAWADSYAAEIRRISDGKASFQLMSRPLVGDLVEVLAMNDPISFQYRGAEQMRTLAADAELWAASRRNTKLQMGAISREAIAAGLETVFAPESDLGSSLLLAEDFCAADPPPVFVVEGRGLVVAKGGRPDLAAALRRAKSGSDDPTASRGVFTCRNGELAVY